MGQNYSKTKDTEVNEQQVDFGEEIDEEFQIIVDKELKCIVQDGTCLSPDIYNAEESIEAIEGNEPWVKFLKLVKEQLTKKLLKMEQCITHRFSEVDIQLKDTVTKVSNRTELKLSSVREEIQNRLSLVDEVGETLKHSQKEVCCMLVNMEKKLGERLASVLNEQREKLHSVQNDLRKEHVNVRSTLQPKLFEVHEQVKVLVESLQRVAFEKSRCQREKLVEVLEIKPTQILSNVEEEKMKIKEDFIQKQRELHEKYDSVKVKINQRLFSMVEINERKEFMMFTERKVISAQALAAIRLEEQRSRIAKWVVDVEGRIENLYSQIRYFVSNRMDEVQYEQELTINEESRSAFRRINILKERTGERLNEVSDKIDSRLDEVLDKALELTNRLQHELDQATVEIQELTGLKIDGVRQMAWQMLDERLHLCCRSFNETRDGTRVNVLEVQQRLWAVEKNLEARVSEADVVIKKRLNEMKAIMERKLHEVKYDANSMLVELLNHTVARINELSAKVENRDQEIRKNIDSRFTEVNGQIQWRTTEAREQLQCCFKLIPEDIYERLEDTYLEVEYIVDDVESWLCALGDKENPI